MPVLGTLALIFHLILTRLLDVRLALIVALDRIRILLRTFPQPRVDGFMNRIGILSRQLLIVVDTDLLQITKRISPHVWVSLLEVSIAVCGGAGGGGGGATVLSALNVSMPDMAS